MKQKRKSLITKLLILGLNITDNIQSINDNNNKRMHSYDSEHRIININDIKSIIKEEEDYIRMIMFKESNIPKFIIFLNLLCDSYQEMLEVTTEVIEPACQDILKQCEVGKNLCGYNIHKSMYYEYVLESIEIKVFKFVLKYYRELLRYLKNSFLLKELIYIILN